jgi:hypothetical protein
MEGSQSPLQPNSTLKSVDPPTPIDSTIAIANTGSTAHFCTTDIPVHNKHLATTPIAIHNPNGNVMYSTHIAELDLPGLPLAARQVHIVPSLTSQSLISIGQFCDAGCTVVFTATTVTVAHTQQVILTGQCTACTRL